MAEQATPTRSTLTRAGWILVAIGVAVMALCVTLGILRPGRDLVRGLTGTEYATPVDRTVTLAHGKYVIFELNGVTITPDQVRVVGPDGSAVATHEMTSSQTIDRNGRVYTGAVFFRTPRGGDYRIQVSATQPTHIVISKDIGSLVLRLLGWILGTGLGFLILAAGVAMLIVSAMRGRRRPPSVAPPGWYPDPAAPGRQRWWNGQNWVG